MPTDRNDNRIRLRATIEAQRLSRLGLRNAEEALKDAQSSLKTEKRVDRRKYLECLASVLEERLDAKIESIMNEEYGGEIGGGSGGFSSGGCAGSD